MTSDDRGTHVVAYEQWGEWCEFEGVDDGCDAFRSAVSDATETSPQIMFQGSDPALAVQSARAYASRELSTSSARIEYCPFCGSKITFRSVNDDE